ncbi:MAG: cellulose biosynthesis cyclic di-GMP-binding regulatory protein BcsB [Rhizobiales bacterium]|nr:cellulose biosynthesis cyclic di-GMP-binding regulatory protein BcsB [Hyphomicrobiales bacterium]
MLARLAIAGFAALAAGASAFAQASLFQPAPMTTLAPPAAVLAGPPSPQQPPPAPTVAAPASPVAKAAPPAAAAPAMQLPARATTPEPATAQKAASAQPVAAPAAQRLRHLPNNAQGYRLAGEIGASEWPIYLTDAQAAAPLRFQLGYLSAVSVMPEASTITVQINDRTIGEARIQAPHAVRTMTLDVPADIVKPGFNSLRIAVQQRHRVDCSLQATYELWTQIDPSQTGFLFAADDPGVASIADLAALPPNPQGGLPVRAILADQTTLASVDHVLRAAQAIAVNGRFEQVLVDVDSGAASDAYGVNLAVGPYLELRDRPGLEALRQPNGPTLQILPNGQGRRPTLVATGSTREEVDAALDELLRAQMLRGADEGLRAAAAFPGLRLSGGQSVRLRDLGIVSQEFSGRMFRSAFQIMMPSDFYAADYAKVQLNLAGGYAAGLTNEAQIVVSVNGRNVVGVKLPKTAGDVFKERAIQLPLGALRPGLNRIEIEAHVPTVADAACDPLKALVKERRFLLLDTTELVIPDIARIARVPDLAVTATGAFPYASGARASRLYMPRPDRETIAAAATLVARLAISAGQFIDFRATSTPPAPGEEPTLVVGAAGTLEPGVLQASGLDDELVRAAWKDFSDAAPIAGREGKGSRFEALARSNLALQRNFPAECRMRAPMSRRAPVEQAARVAPANSESLYDNWRQTQRDSSQVYAFGRAMVTWFGERLVLFRRITSALIRQLAPERVNEDQSRVVRPNMSLLMSQANLSGDESGVWTLVTAPTSAALMETMACAVDPRVWAQVRGRIAALDPSEAQIAALRASELNFVSTQPFSVQNARLIAAGWFSINRWTYAGIILFVAFLLGSSTFWLVRNIGRRQP